MRYFFLLLFFITCFHAGAQNYQCLQDGVKHYFINSDGYLRGIRIDSVRAIGGNTIFYPYHTIRGDYIGFSLIALDSNGGSWLGKKVLQQSDGTFLFDNYWSDTIVIKTQAHIADSWTFFRDTATSHYYKATVVSEGTMTVLGSLDSVKTITIKAYNSSAPDTTDSLNNFRIVLSKNNGFVAAFDLYMFPYHRPDTAYTLGHDFYTDYLLNFTGLRPQRYGGEQFSLVDFIDPAYTQLYDWNAGDVFENSVFDLRAPSSGLYPYEYDFDSIINKTSITGGISYDYSGWKATQHLPLPLYFVPGTNYPYDTSSVTGSFTVNNIPLMDTGSMPEEFDQQNIWYYFPADTSFCRIGPMYQLIYAAPNHVDYDFEIGPPTTVYKMGLGLLNWTIDGRVFYQLQDTTLIFYMKNDTGCGEVVQPSPIYDVAFVHNITTPAYHIYPNPVSGVLTISPAAAGIYTAAVSNVVGSIYKTITTAGNLQIDVSNLPPGIYTVTISGENQIQVKNKFVVVH